MDNSVGFDDLFFELGNFFEVHLLDFFVSLDVCLLEVLELLVEVLILSGYPLVQFSELLVPFFL